VPTDAWWRWEVGHERLLIAAVHALGTINLPPGLRPTCEAGEDRGAGLPTGTTWAQARGVGHQFGFPLRRQGLAYERRPRPFVGGGNPQRARLRAATCGHPRAAPRGRCAIALALARAWPALGREQRFHPSAAHGMFPALVLGPPTPRSQPCLPGLAEQVWALAYCADITTWRGSGPSLVEAEAMALDWLPGDVVPGRHQGLAILCVGSWPLPYHGTFQGTGPTSASPGHSPWPWLLRVSSSPAAWGWRLRREVTAAQRAADGYAVPRSHGWPP
jgi:hypothetical protein